MESLHDITILYIEDDESTRLALERFLKRRAGAVLCAASAIEGLELYKEYKPDIIILDLLMPEMSGWDFIQKIRQQDHNTRIIVTSTVNEVSKVLDAVNQRIDGYVNKPIDSKQLEFRLISIAGEIEAAKKKEYIHIPENKTGVEEEMRKSFTKLLKNTSGRGGKEVRIKVGADTVTITAKDTLNAMEKAMLKNYDNLGVVNENRKLFYKTISKNIEEIVTAHIGCSFKITSIDVNSGKETDTIILTAYRKR